MNLPQPVSQIWERHFLRFFFTLPHKIIFMDWPLISIISVKYPKDNLWTCMCRVKLLKCKKKYQILWAHVSLLKYSMFWRENVQYYSDTKFHQGGLQWTNSWLVVSFYLSYLWHRQLQNKAIFFVIGSKSRPITIYYFLCLPSGRLIAKPDLAPICFTKIVPGVVM